MQLTPIKVESYAGHKADETPRRFSADGQWIEIVEVLDRWYQIDSQPEWPRATSQYESPPGLSIRDSSEATAQHDLTLKTCEVSG